MRLADVIEINVETEEEQFLVIVLALLVLQEPAVNMVSEIYFGFSKKCAFFEIKLSLEFKCFVILSLLVNKILK